MPEPDGRFFPARLSEVLHPLADLSALPLGDQEPTDRLVPAAQYSHGHDAIALAALAGLDLYDFQKQALIDEMGVNFGVGEDGRTVETWAALETLDLGARRNGKSTKIAAKILFCLFILREPKIMYTAHRDDTANDVFDEVAAAIERVPALLAQVAHFRRTNGQRAIHLKPDRAAGEQRGPRVEFKTRSEQAQRGRGFVRLIFDEAQEATVTHIAAMMPVVSGEKNSQIDYAANAGKPESIPLAGVWRDYEAGAPSLCVRAWVGSESDDRQDIARIARLNPAIGRHLSWKWVAKEEARIHGAKFLAERFTVNNFAREDDSQWVVPEDAVRAALDEDSTPVGGLVFVPECDPDLAYGTIVVAGRRADGGIHIEPVEFAAGVGWIPDRWAELVATHHGAAWIDPRMPAAEYLLGEIKTRRLDLDPRTFTAEQVAAAHTWFWAAINPQPDPHNPGAGKPPPGVWHRGPERLMAAFANAKTRKLLNRWAWSRMSPVHVGPLMGGTLAGYAVQLEERRTPPPPPPRGVGKAGARRPIDRSAMAPNVATVQF